MVAENHTAIVNKAGCESKLATLFDVQIGSRVALGDLEVVQTTNLKHILGLTKAKFEDGPLVQVIWNNFADEVSVSAEVADAGRVVLLDNLNHLVSDPGRNLTVTSTSVNESSETDRASSCGVCKEISGFLASR